MPTSQASRTLTSIGLTLLLVSVAVNVFQAQHIRALVEPRTSSNVVGSQVPALPVSTLTGDNVTVRLGDGRPTLLYFFSPTCQWCDRNWDNVLALANSTQGRLRIIALAAEPGPALRHVADRYGASMEIYGSLPIDVRDALAFRSTPQTLVVSSQGIVSHQWAGAFRGRLAGDIEDVFGVLLPGLTQAHD